MDKPTTIDKDEIQKFENMALEWWDLNGKFKPLHLLNPTRLKFIKENIQNHFPKKPFSQIKLLDIGCGGGLVSEPLSNIGLDVTGIDASNVNINIAKTHAEKSQINTKYVCTTAEDLVAKQQKFDVVIALEIVEHVNDVELFLKSCALLVKPGGLFIISTINKTAKSYALAILGAEYILKWLPIGTHDWHNFLPPSSIIKEVEKENLSPKLLQGLGYCIFNKNWKLSKNTDVNYMLVMELKKD